jgi:NADH-quinone oxidoreductase subunit M
MPGSANFIGEFYILNGLFQAKIVFAFVAISGVAMSAYYALRLYQRTMHNRGDSLSSREIDWRDGTVLAPLVLCIVGLALYPQLILKRTDSSVTETVAALKGPPGVASKSHARGAKPFPLECVPTARCLSDLETTPGGPSPEAAARQ